MKWFHRHQWEEVATIEWSECRVFSTAVGVTTVEKCVKCGKVRPEILSGYGLTPDEMDFLNERLRATQTVAEGPKP